VIHIQLPDIENHYQEAGRAGRNDEKHFKFCSRPIAYKPKINFEHLPDKRFFEGDVH
jgi:ATP-dependent DNA helicase RecQ